MRVKIIHLFLSEGMGINAYIRADRRKKTKGAPYFFDLDFKVEDRGKTLKTIEGVKVTSKEFVLGDGIVLVESVYEVDVTKSDCMVLNEKIRKSLQMTDKFYEEYTVILVSSVNKPKEWLAKNSKMVAGLIRGNDKPLDSDEVESVLKSRVKYSQTDLAVVDWDGGVLVGDSDDFESEIDLMKLANYQLLRYRIIDRELRQSLEEISKLLAGKKLWLPQKNLLLRRLVDRRLDLMLDLEQMTQSLLLIGDWYTAQLYQMLSEELYLNDWKKIVDDKLNLLGEVYESINNNLTFSWERLFDLFSVVGWAILLVGYFVLFFIDMGAYK